ncbi:DinB family protein [Pseudomonas sp. UFMG81]|uniref:DinB family protein n=1 Tax=Pseudomonas sp. UFMG81 TaxID=2745936 RepID=UPI00188FA826|nr:DinB family protein [Pseudomonas sp. UFMG81]
MINPSTAKMLANYKHWADKLMYESLAALPPEELAKEHAGPLKNIMGILNHVYVIDRIWQGHVLERDHGHLSKMEIPYPDFTNLRKAQKEINEWFVSWAAHQTDSSLSRELHFNFLSGRPGVMTIGTMFLHTVNHSTFHRGWLTQIFFEIPAPPPATDLCVYLTEVYSERANTF